MRFWDSSALVPALIQEDASARVFELLNHDEEVAVWWSTEVECWSAVVRAQRNGRIDERIREQAGAVLNEWRTAWTVISPADEVRRQARRLLSVYRLRTADALQLGAALVWTSRYDSTELVVGDGPLIDAAGREGFDVVLAVV